LNSQPEMLKLKRRTAGHMDQDGLTEIGTGLLFIIMGFFMTQNSLLVLILVLLLLIIVKLLEMASIVPLNIIRERFIYPRTGYVKLHYEDVKPPSRFAAFITFSFIFFAYILLFNFAADGTIHSRGVRWNPVLLGGIVGSGGLAINKAGRIPKRILYALAAIAFGLLVSIVNSHETIPQGGALLCTWYGVFMLAAGIVVLIRFMIKYRNHPIEKYDEQ
jgi:hypothetical protein